MPKRIIIGVLLAVTALFLGWRLLNSAIVLPQPAAHMNEPLAPPTSTSSGAVSTSHQRPVASVDMRWGRAQSRWDPEHWPLTKGDWIGNPNQWRLYSIEERADIPATIAGVLRQLNCAVPIPVGGASDRALLWGEFERPGQLDFVVLCAHADKTSSVYIFWAGDALRRETMPISGAWVAAVRRADLETGVSMDKPLEADMPTSVTHDGINIGCCDCCSTIYYRHEGQWFTLPGED